MLQQGEITPVEVVSVALGATVPNICNCYLDEETTNKSVLQPPTGRKIPVQIRNPLSPSDPFCS